MLKKVIISNKTFEFDDWWNGQKIDSQIIALDTETNVIEDNLDLIPQLALASCSAGYKGNYLIHPKNLARFLELHNDKHFVFHNIAFDFWVINQHLETHHEQNAAGILWKTVDKGFAHDTMLLDMLVRLAINDDYPDPRSLGVIGLNYAGLKIDKEDPYRLRYGELLGKESWDGIEDGFIEYAIKDPITTYLAFIKLFSKAKDIVKKACVSKNIIEKYGVLTESIQIKGAISLYKITANGISIDLEHAKKTHEEFKNIVNEVTLILLNNEKYKDVFSLHKKTGQMQFTKHGNPKLSLIKLREILLNVAKEIEENSNIKVNIPKTKKNFIGTSSKAWEDYKDYHEFLKLYHDLVEYSKLCQFFKKIDKRKIHPRYNYMVRTGRTSSFNINLQQIPKHKGMREIFQASDGKLLLAVDYSMLEMCTLGYILEEMYGKSVMADIIKEGKDLHIYCSALFNGMTYEEFEDLKNTNIKKYEEHRQSSKITNYGFCGGLSAKSLVTYAKLIYKTVITEEQSKVFREKWTKVVYPEMDRYLTEDSMLLLADNLNQPVYKLWNAFDWSNSRNPAVPAVIRKVVKGNCTKANGTPYNEIFVDKIWSNLQALNNNPNLTSDIQARSASEALYRDLFWTKVLTPTGRIRGRVSYTQVRNTPFQGIAADGGKLALWELMKNGYKDRVIGFIHDEALAELDDLGGCVDKNEIDKIMNIMCKSMESVTGNIPIKTDFVLSKKWKKKGKVKIENNKVYPI